MYLLGTHGTCRSRANQIIACQSFKPSEKGWYGAGAYFWSYEEKIGLAQHRAELWWKFAAGKQMFATDEDASCALLSVEILKTENYLDATDESLIENFYEATKCKNINEEERSQAFAWFIDQIQISEKINYLVIKASVPNPPVSKGNDPELPQIMSKMAPVYIVREGGLHLIEKILPIN